MDDELEFQADNGQDQNMQVDTEADIIDINKLPIIWPLSRSPSVEIVERSLSPIPHPGAHPHALPMNLLTIPSLVQ